MSQRPRRTGGGEARPGAEARPLPGAADIRLTHRSRAAAVMAKGWWRILSLGWPRHSTSAPARRNGRRGIPAVAIPHPPGPGPRTSAPGCRRQGRAGKRRRRGGRSFVPDHSVHLGVEQVHHQQYRPRKWPCSMRLRPAVHPRREHVLSFRRFSTTDASRRIVHEPHEQAIPPLHITLRRHSDRKLRLGRAGGELAAVSGADGSGDFDGAWAAGQLERHGERRLEGCRAG